MQEEQRGAVGVPPQRAREELLESLVELQRELTERIGDTDAIFALLVERITELMVHADGAIVILPEPSPDGVVRRLVYRAAGGHLADKVGAGVDAHDSLAGRAFTTGEPQIANDVADNPYVDHAACLRTGVQSMITVPLVAPRGTLGVLKVASRHPHAFDADDLRVTTLLAHALSAAIEQSRYTDHITELLSDSVAARRELAVTEERFRLAFSHGPQPMLITVLENGLAGRAQRNAAAGVLAARIGEQALVDAHAHHLARLVAGEDEELDEQLDRADLLEDGVRTLRVHTRIARGVEDAAPRAVVTVVEDRTDQLATERRLAEHARLLENANDAILGRDLSGAITYWNPGAERTYGWPAVAAVGRDLDRLLGTTYPEGASRASIEAELLREGAWSGELTHRHRDGREVVVAIRKALVSGQAGEPHGVLTVATDVTARRLAERRLAASEALFRSQFEHSAIGQAIRGTDDRFESVNPAFARMLGYDDPAEIVGRPASAFARAGDVARRDAAAARIVAGEIESAEFDVELIRKDGSLLPVRFVTSVLRDEQGRPTRFVSHFDDISERRRAEAARDAALAQLQTRHDELAVANGTLEAVSSAKTDLISLLGHELKNPLSVLLMATELARSTWEVEPGSDQDVFLTQVGRSASRLQVTVAEVLEMMAAEAGRLAARPSPVEVAPVLQAVLADHRVAPMLECADDVRALVQPEHLVQMVGNLLSNAVKYGGGRELLQLRAGSCGGRVRIAVVDHGAGVPADFEHSLFERFTRSAGDAARVEGSGVGLYLIRELARANGGDVVHTVTPGGGATFTIDLPAA